ncbi:MAG: hypothetical protein V3U54_04095 [Thermodesulfobacteriota bacterium]
MEKLTIEEMRIIAEEHNGKCLSKRYKNARTRLKWRCAEGHIWKAMPDSVKNQGSWCQRCINKRIGKSLQLSIEIMQEIAKERGGKCLSDTYVNNKTPLLWKCSEGHQWKAKPDGVKNKDTWCQKCFNKRRGKSRRLNIQMMQEIAKQRGGKCLSETYVNVHTKLRWECSEGHRWEAQPANIKSNKWCPDCGGVVKRTIEEMRRVAEERGGKCLSNVYVNAHTKLLWKCSEGHKWSTTPHIINHDRWCKECSSGLGERICREFFEQIFEKKFPSSYPKWLVNKKGNQMELDGYCQSLALAFEHHGEQHYSDKTHFTKIGKSFRRRQEDDRLKRKLCKQKEIVLIEIPEIPNRLSIKEVKAFIKKNVRVTGFLYLPILIQRKLT